MILFRLSISFSIKWVILLVISNVSLLSPYKLHSSLNAVVYTDIEDDMEMVHSEYYFGKCYYKNRELIIKDVYNYTDVQGTSMIRSWINVKREPTCAIIKARSNYLDHVKYEAYRFGFCLNRIHFNYGGLLHAYYYYEWFIPVKMYEGVSWAILLYYT